MPPPSVGNTYSCGNLPKSWGFTNIGQLVDQTPEVGLKALNQYIGAVFNSSDVIGPDTCDFHGPPTAVPSLLPSPLPLCLLPPCVAPSLSSRLSSLHRSRQAELQQRGHPERRANGARQAVEDGSMGQPAAHQGRPAGCTAPGEGPHNMDSLPTRWP